MPPVSWSVSDYIRLYQTISDYIRLYQTISDYIRLYQTISDFKSPWYPHFTYHILIVILGFLLGFLPCCKPRRKDSGTWEVGGRLLGAELYHKVPMYRLCLIQRNNVLVGFQWTSHCNHLLRSRMPRNIQKFFFGSLGEHSKNGSRRGWDFEKSMTRTKSHDFFTVPNDFKAWGLSWIQGGLRSASDLRAPDVWLGGMGHGFQVIQVRPDEAEGTHLWGVFQMFDSWCRCFPGWWSQMTVCQTAKAPVMILV